jgi:hypothetical protein
METIITSIVVFLLLLLNGGSGNSQKKPDTQKTTQNQQNAGNQRSSTPLASANNPPAPTPTPGSLTKPVSPTAIPTPALLPGLVGLGLGLIRKQKLEQTEAAK